jgi:hypothetical protein
METDSGGGLRRLVDRDWFEEDSVVSRTRNHVIDLAGDDRQGDPDRIGRTVRTSEVPAFPASRPGCREGRWFSVRFGHEFPSQATMMRIVSAKRTTTKSTKRFR